MSLAGTLLVSAILVNSGFHGTQAQTPTPCSTEEYRQLDFWVGEWALEWDNPDGSKGAGTNNITKSAYGSCVISEHFSGQGLNGLSVSTYHAPVGKWRQTWVDDQGGYFALVGGPVTGEEHSFEVVNTRLSDQAPHLRMIWQDVTENTLTWRWQQRATEADDWQDSWLIRYTRVTGAQKD
jgi:hypothetical protein